MVPTSLKCRESLARLHGLYAIADPDVAGIEPVPLVEALLQGGARVVQLRWKSATGRELFAAALLSAPRCRDVGALFIVNDRPDVAALVDADGVHLGQDDVPVGAARRVLPEGALVGVSTHSDAELDRAIASGADYVGFGPVFPTATKDAALPPPHGLAGLRRACLRAGGTAVVAIGGMTAARAMDALAAGARAVAAIGDLYRGGNVAARVREYPRVA